MSPATDAAEAPPDPPPDRPRRSGRTRLLLALKLVVSAGLLTVVLLSVDRAALLAEIGAVPVSLLAGLVALILAMGVLQGLRWRIVLAGAEGHRRRFPAERIVLLSLFFLQVVPSVLGADAARAIAAGRAGVAAGDAVASVVVDRLIALAVLVLISVAALPILFAVAGDDPAVWSAAALLGMAVAGYAAILALRWLPGSLADNRLVGALLRPVSLLWAVIRDPAAVAGAVALSLAIHAGSLTILGLLAAAVGIAAPAPALAAVGLAILIVTMVPVSIAGWGVREGAAVVAFGFVGADPASAVAASILFGGVLAAAGILGGLIWLAGNLTTPRR